MKATTKTIKRLTDMLMALQKAYFEHKGEWFDDVEGDSESGMLGELWIHEAGSKNEQGISIDLYNFEGDGLPVCDGLRPCKVTLDDGSTDTGWVFCMSYYPNNDKPLSFVFNPADGEDYDVAPEGVPEEVLQNVAKWLEGKLPKDINPLTSNLYEV